MPEKEDSSEEIETYSIDGGEPAPIKPGSFADRMNNGGFGFGVPTDEFDAEAHAKATGVPLPPGYVPLIKK